ncbi:MAG TPA: hypothetical protein VFG10_07100 [Saprospiraceae bacterium]|nr:hypothetical protein [Saprospiraceae bacterium]
MSHLINSSCWICGEEYESLMFGAGISQKVLIVPAMDKATNKICAVASGDDEHFRYYTDPSMYELSDATEFITWHELQLSNVNNYCPECEEFSMDFEVVGEWD